MIVAIDPGPTQSAWIVAEESNGRIIRIIGHGISANQSAVEDANRHVCGATRCAIEMVACYGMAVGAEVFDTCVWIGRFIERLRDEPIRVYRRDVKMHLCGSMRAKDPNVRQALIDKYGPPGTKAQKGLLYGIKSHLWAALAVADYAASKH